MSSKCLGGIRIVSVSGMCLEGARRERKVHRSCLEGVWKEHKKIFWTKGQVKSR